MPKMYSFDDYTDIDSTQRRTLRRIDRQGRNYIFSMERGKVGGEGYTEVKNKVPSSRVTESELLQALGIKKLGDSGHACDVGINCHLAKRGRLIAISI